MREALDRYYVRGLSTNLTFLSHICKNEKIRSGDMSTNFIGDHYPDGMTEELLAPEDPALFAAVAAVIQTRMEENQGALSGRLTPAAPFRSGEFTAFVGLKDKQELEVSLSREADQERVEIGGHIYEISSGWKPGEPSVPRHYR